MNLYIWVIYNAKAQWPTMRLARWWWFQECYMTDWVRTQRQFLYGCHILKWRVQIENKPLASFGLRRGITMMGLLKVRSSCTPVVVTYATIPWFSEPGGVINRFNKPPCKGRGSTTIWHSPCSERPIWSHWCPHGVTPYNQKARAIASIQASAADAK